MKFYDKQKVYSLEGENRQNNIGEYFQIVKYKEKFHLYYSCENTIKLAVSDTPSFLSCNAVTVLRDAPGGCFCIIEHEDKLFMLCGHHGSDKSSIQYEIPDLVWPKETKFLIDWNEERLDRKNGMYLLSSNDGVCWENVINTPVLHGFISSDTCKLGEVCFDTSPCVIKDGDEFIYYGRLNSSLDERRIYLRKSKDLINWSPPQKIRVTNENINDRKKNYYNPVAFKHEKTFYMFTPYFEACGTEKRVCQNGSTLLLKSDDGLSWEITHSFLPHEGKYKNRVNDVCFHDSSKFIFFRENTPLPHQSLFSYNFNFEGDLSKWTPYEKTESNLCSYYYKKACKMYNNSDDVGDIYKSTIKTFDVEEINKFDFSQDYFNIIDNLCELKDNYLRFGDRNDYTIYRVPHEAQHGNEEVEIEINKLLNIILPMVEEQFFQSNVAVSYSIFRRTFIRPEPPPNNNSTWQWHVDSYPDEVNKLIIYLSDVSENQAPFTYLVDEDENPVLLNSPARYIDPKKQFRDSFQEINPGILNDRVPAEWVEEKKRLGYREKMWLGKRGSFSIFRPNVIHKATVPKELKRDVVSFTLRPSITKRKSYWFDSPAKKGFHHHDWYGSEIIQKERW